MFEGWGPQARGLVDVSVGPLFHHQRRRRHPASCRASADIYRNHSSSKAPSSPNGPSSTTQSHQHSQRAASHCSAMPRTLPRPGKVKAPANRSKTPSSSHTFSLIRLPPPRPSSFPTYSMRTTRYVARGLSASSRLVGRRACCSLCARQVSRLIRRSCPRSWERGCIGFGIGI